MDYADVNKDTLKECVRSVLFDGDMQVNLAKVRELIGKAPGNPGGAKEIIDYCKSIRDK